MDKLDQVIQNYEGPDGAGATSPHGTDGVDISIHGTVTIKQRPLSKPGIPESFVNPSHVIFYYYLYALLLALIIVCVGLACVFIF